MKFRNSCRSGSALVIILPIIAILALIILTVLSIALFDNRLASSSFAQAQAGSMVKYAIDDVSDKLYQIPLDRHWAAGPGRIRYWDGVSNWTNIELYSGTNSTTPAAASNYLDGATAAAAAQCVQLNVPLPDGSYTIMSTNSAFPTAPDMTVKWIYVLQDGTIQTNSALLPNQGVIGRYAYWTDVENGRVNINTAGFGMVNGPPTGNTNNPTGRFQWAVEGWTGLFSPSVTGFGANANLATYAANVLTPNPWMSDILQTNSTGVTFANATYPTLDRPTAQANTIQNLTAHPSSIDLSFLDGVSVTQSFNTFRYAGSYFLRVDARNSYACFGPSPAPPVDASFSPTPNPDLSIRFFNDPSDWQLIVDPATYQRNKGYITVRGRSPEINPWGLPKVALSMSCKDGHALNDLTEYYRRTVTPTTPLTNPLDTEDSRLTQVPSVLLPNQPAAQTTPNKVNPPYLVQGGRANFRDLEYIQSGNCNFLYVATLINDLKNILNTSCPGFNTSLGAKYNAYGSTGGETEQIAVEIMTFADSCLNGEAPAFARFSDYGGVSFYGETLPMATAATEALSTRRQGTSGEYLINEIAMQAQSVTYAQLYKPAAPSLYALTPTTTNSVVTPVPTPKAVLTVNNGNPTLFFFLRQPLDAATPNPNLSSTDMFIKIILRAEMITPPHLGFAQPVEFINPEGDIANTVIQYSTNSTDGTTATGTWNTLNYDICGNQKVDGVGSNTSPDVPPVYTSDNPVVGYFQNPLYPDQAAFQAVRVFAAPATGPTINPSIDSYAEMTANTSRAILIGPFAPNTVVSLKVKSRLLFEDGGQNGSAEELLETVPGIYPDFPSAFPGSVGPPLTAAAASYTANLAAGNADPNDPYPPSTTSITDNWLEFDFPLFNVTTSTDAGSLLPNPVVSYEATDPRMTRRATDWKLCTNPFGNTLGTVNSTVSAPNPIPDDSKLARPPAFLSVIRGPVRATALTSYNLQPEMQTASKILGLPGVGYLSEVPTGVDTGLLPSSGVPSGTLTQGGAWSTMKFHATTTDTPPDWLLWNLFYVPFDRSMSNQTDGKLNINARLYPFTDASGNVLVREKPLEALLGNRVSNPATLATAIAAGPTYTNGGALPSDLYVYPGQICQIPGFADSSVPSSTNPVNEYDEERLPRDLADIVTTQSSDYRVFVVAQALKQSPTGQITPVTTQRVEATLSRVVDAGKPGYAFAMNDAGTYPFYVYLRGAYRPTASGAPVPSAARVDVEAPARVGSPTPGYSPLGVNHTPNDLQNWLIPQKIEISSYKIVK